MKPMRRCGQNRWWPRWGGGAPPPPSGRGRPYREYGQRVRQSVPRRAEQVPGLQGLDATPERDNSVPSRARLSRACAVASPQAGPCSALRHAADFGHNPEGWREFCIRALSRPEAKSCQRRMGFIMLGTLSTAEVGRCADAALRKFRIAGVPWPAVHAGTRVRSQPRAAARHHAVCTSALHRCSQ